MDRDARYSLGISQDDWPRTKEKAQGGQVQVLGLRFENDRTSRPERFETLHNELGLAFQPVIIPHDRYADWGIDEHAHPVLTYCTPPQCQKPDTKAFETMVQFLQAR